MARNEGNAQRQARENLTERRIATKADEERAVRRFIECWAVNQLCAARRHVTTFNSEQLSDVDLIIPDLWRRKQRHGEVKLIVQGH